MQPDEMKTARKSLGWTQQQLADGLGMSRKSIVEMEGGAAPIEKRTALAVSLLRALPLMNKRISGRFSDIQWQPTERGFNARLGEFVAWIGRETQGRWSVAVIHDGGYSVPYPQWESSEMAAKAAAVLAAQKGYADLAEGAITY